MLFLKKVLAPESRQTHLMEQKKKPMLKNPDSWESRDWAYDGKEKNERA